jgi:transposase InsO family protein
MEIKTMSWQEKNRVNLRKEFIFQALKKESNISELCRRYSISRKTAYKWLKRYKKSGECALHDQSRKPKHNPKKLPKKIVESFVRVRNKHPYWGARKLQAILKREFPNIKHPAPSTIHKVLSQQGYIKSQPKKDTPPLIRFEHDAPNRLWQMDFKGYFAHEKGRCFPLTILDDHSRFSIGLKACANERGNTIRPVLIEIFKRYGLPERINVDNGNPWGNLHYSAKYTTFSIWLIQLGIKISYSRPWHPQTNGKEERFHRTLKLELINNTYFRDLFHIQECFDEWRDIYNLERPHEGIGMQVPADRYKPSYRTYPEIFPDITYPDDYELKKIDKRGRLLMEGRQIFIGIPFSKKTIGIKRGKNSGAIEVYFCHQKLGQADFNKFPKNNMLNLYSKKLLVI